MALSLGFHIIFAAVGVTLPLLMVLAERRFHQTQDIEWLELAKRWAKGTAILFAVGAVSGTVLSFELGLLWPKFMEKAGPVIGMPFSLEGFAFFTEAIFLGIYLYGWNKISPRTHMFAGWIVAISGALSAAFVTTVNGWMNTPQGFEIVDGQVQNVDLLEAIFNPASFHEIPHTLLSCYAAAGFAVVAVHAYYLRKKSESAFHRKGLLLGLAVAGVASILLPISGDLSAKAVAKLQPAKLAAMEGQFKNEPSYAPLRIGGIPNEETEQTDWAIEIPGALSFLAFSDPAHPVQGLESFTKENWPPVAVVHIAFQIMVSIGIFLMLVSFLSFYLWKRKPDILWKRNFLTLLLVCGPLGFLAMEAGWIVTEVGRQPWIVYGIWKTAETVTPMPGLAIPFTVFSIVYFLLCIAVILLLRRQFRYKDPTGKQQIQHLVRITTTAQKSK